MSTKDKVTDKVLLQLVERCAVAQRIDDETQNTIYRLEAELSRLSKILEDGGSAWQAKLDLKDAMASRNLKMVLAGNKSAVLVSGRLEIIEGIYPLNPED